jgi:hypothetical protein
MGADIVVGLVPLFQLLVMLPELQPDIFDFIKLLPMRPVRPLP